ncbi:MAG: regulatory protein RecX [Chloroflexi bacterium]|nr:regulatory protein RecX [Chloroflexota bacterium]
MTPQIRAHPPIRDAAPATKEAIVIALEPAARGQVLLRLWGPAEGHDLEPFLLSKRVAQEAGLRSGQTLNAAEHQALLFRDDCYRAHQAALGLLRYRPRSRGELAAHLAHRGLDPVASAAALDRLEELGLVDDARFARAWREHRETFSPRSARRVRQELLQKGLAPPEAAAATADMQDEDSAYRAAQPRARRLAHLEFGDFETKIGTFLLRRGFSFRLARATARRLWEEKLPASASPPSREG